MAELELTGAAVYVLCMALVALGLFGLALKRNLIKIIISLGIIETGINLFIIAIGYSWGGTAPIFTGMPGGVGPAAPFVDPIPQALTLTSIVIGASVTALALGIAIRLHNATHSFNADEVGDRTGVKP